MLIQLGVTIKKPFVCTECDSVTIRKDLYKKYLQLHLNDKSFFFVFVLEGDFECKVNVILKDIIEFIQMLNVLFVKSVVIHSP